MWWIDAVGFLALPFAPYGFVLRMSGRAIGCWSTASLPRMVGAAVWRQRSNGTGRQAVAARVCCCDGAGVRQHVAGSRDLCRDHNHVVDPGPAHRTASGPRWRGRRGVEPIVALRAIARRTLKFGDRIGPVLRHLIQTDNDFVVDRRNGAATPSPTGGGGGGGSTPAAFDGMGNSITPSRIMQMRAQVFNDPPAATRISMRFSAGGVKYRRLGWFIWPARRRIFRPWQRAGSPLGWLGVGHDFPHACGRA